MDKIKFSVIIPTHNRYKSGLLGKAVGSVLSQDADDYVYELIVVDDGSDVSEKDLVKGISELSDKITFIFLEKDIGTPGAIQAGIKKAKGEYIVILGDDDILPPNSLKDRAEYIRSHPDFDWFYGKTQLLNDSGEPIRTISQSEKFDDHHYARMFLYNYIQGGTTTVKRSVYNGIEWPKWLDTRDDDFISFELVRPGKYKFGFLDKVLYGYRTHTIDQRQSEKNMERKKHLEEIDRKIRYELHDSELAFLADKAHQAAHLEVELKEREDRLNRIYNSLLWKITWPIRKIKHLIKND